MDKFRQGARLQASTAQPASQPPSTPTLPLPPLPALPPLLSLQDLRSFGITYSRAHIARLVKNGQFPAPVAFGPTLYARKAPPTEKIF